MSKKKPEPAAPLSKEQLEANLSVIRQQEFLEKYQALCAEYNMRLVADVKFVVTPN